MKKRGSFFNSTPYELDNFLCGIGEASIEKDHIVISNYPFRPSSVFPQWKLLPSQIQEVHVDTFPPTLKVNEELIFISREKVIKLHEFRLENDVMLSRRNANWDLLTEPFLDTEFNEAQKKKTFQQLEFNGIGEGEVISLRKEVKEQMMKYNFDTMLWEWTSLGLNDVLAAMRVKYNEQKFKDFYWRAMEVEQRAGDNKRPGADHG